LGIAWALTAIDDGHPTLRGLPTADSCQRKTKSVFFAGSYLANFDWGWLGSPGRVMAKPERAQALASFCARCPGL